ncbi:uncharacterized protein LOC109841927 [Asparagus officinalis]|uniref:uncharacterized protein LOC109841927 n=1 Tax=Asparagus officinalis TaxID=4686 RepID=UPI00098DE85B|nr:uncharacterized protein LOC109841927 [Asparagus officinalis]
MSSRYVKGIGRSCQQSDEITIEHHYRFDILYEVVNTQVMELSERFSDRAVELLSLSSALDPKDSFKSFKVDDLCMLAKKYYPQDFSEMEINYQLRHQLQHYEHDMRCDPDFQNITTLSGLCQKLVSKGKSRRYPLIDRLIRLVLTPASTERAFSAMKLIKTSLRNKMGDEMLANNMILYIEKEITSSLDTEEIVEEFDSRANKIPGYATKFFLFDAL